MRQTNYQGALQKPIGSGFNAASTTSDVITGIDLTGKVAIVTGGYAGIGLETVKTFAAAGATVIVPARDIDKARKNLAGIPNVELEPLDLMDPKSIEAFAEIFLASNRSLPLLINNAGIMWAPLQRDSRGYESHLSTNHLGHFQLTALLWPALKKAHGARVINVSSWGHHFSPFIFDDPNFERRDYQQLAGYGQSKTANILFALELNYRGEDFGVQSYSLHPGAIVETELGRRLSNEDLQGLGVYDKDNKVIYDPSKGLKTISQGAATTVWCATSLQLNDFGGVYCENAEIAELDTQTGELENFVDRMNKVSKITGVMPYALDKETAKKLWTLSEELTGVKFNIS